MNIMKQQAVYILFLLGICHIVLDLPIKYNDINAYEVLDGCPLDRNDWENASDILNCSKPKDSLKNRYHCMPNRQKTKLLEFCYPRDRVRMSPGFCFVLADNGLITKYDDTSCKDFINNSCQMTYDEANEMYNYPACLRINPNKSCYTSDPECPSIHVFDSTRSLETTTIDISGTSQSTNASIENQGHPGAEEKKTDLIPVIVVIVLIVLGVGIAAGIFLYKKNRGCIKKDSTSERIPLLDVPSISHGSITLNPGGEVKLSAQLADNSPPIKSTTWKKGDIVIDFEKYHGKYSTNVEDQHLCITIHNLDLEEQGEYSCYVTSNTGVVSEPFVFNLEIPSISHGDITLDPEGEVKLSAQLADISPPIISTTWKKDDIVIDFEKCHGKYTTNVEDQHLCITIHNMDLEDQGEYSCYVTSNTGVVSEPFFFNLGAAEVELNFIPSVPLGEMRCAKLTASFTCNVLDVLWLKWDGIKTETIQINQEKYSGNVFSSIKEMNLFINDVNKSDAGYYWVIVKTENGVSVSRKKELEVLQENRDTIFADWIRENNHFVPRSASTMVKDSLESNKIVIITGEEGSGKSAITHHVGLYLKNTKGYRIIPISHVRDINTFWLSSNTNVCYIIDDPFGKSVLDISKMFHYIAILPQIQTTNHVRLLMSVSRPIYDKIVGTEKITSGAAMVNLSLEPLTDIERNKICEAYHVPANVQQNMDKIQNKKESFPLLCSLYEGEKFDCQGRNFLPEYEKHVEENLGKSHPGFLALIILCLFNNNILNKMSVQNKTIKEWVCTYFKIRKEDLEEAFNSLTSARPYLESSFYEDSIYTVKNSMVLEVVLGLIKQKTEATFDWRRIPSFILGLFLKKLKSSLSVPFDVFFYLNSLNLCEVFQSDEIMNLLEKIDISEKMSLCDWHEVFLSEAVFDIITVCGINSFGDFNLTKEEMEFYGYTLLFSIEATHYKRDGNKKMLKTKILWWVTQFGSVPLLKNILQTKDEEKQDERFVKEMDRLLNISCFSNSVEKAKLVLNHGKKCMTEDAENCVNFVTPVTIAFYRKNEHLLKLLKSEGAKLDDTEINGASLLSASINDTDSDPKFRKFLAKEVEDINKDSSNGKTALFIASEVGDIEIVKVLMKRNADVNKVGPRSRTPLFVALAEGEKEDICYKIVKELVKNQARIGFYDSCGRSSLHLASQKGYLQIVKYLVIKGANVNKPDCNNTTPLHLAVTFKQFEVAEYLISQNANINHPDNAGQSPLYIAAKLELKNILKLLIKQGGDVNTSDNEGNTPLHIAIGNVNTKMVKFLLSRNAKTNIFNKDLNRPLHLAACICEEKIDIVKLLLKKNTDVNVTNKQGQTPLFRACTKGNYEIVKELATSDTSVNLKDSEDRTPLHEASKKGHKELVEYLVRKGDASNINANDKYNRTPLYCACESGNIEIIRHLLEKGAIVHLCDRENVTPLILVSRTGPKERVELIVEYLIDKSQINRCDNEGKSPLHYAVSAQLKDVVEYLIKNKADTKKKDDSGKTPEDIASKNNFHDSWIQILENSSEK